MITNTKLKTKIFGGFSIVLVLLIIVAGAGYLGLSFVLDKADKADDMNSIINSLLTIRRHEKNYIIRNNLYYFEKVEKTIEEIRNQALKTREKFKQKNSRQMMDNIIEGLGSYEKEFRKYSDLKTREYPAENAPSDKQEADIMSDEYNLVMAARNIEQYAVNALEKQKAELEIRISQIKTTVAAATFITVLLGFLLSSLITNGIIKHLNRIIQGLNESSEELHIASLQRTSASMQLAEGSSEQAAASEQTSASLEEISSMTRQNADNAIQADQLMSEVSEVVKDANFSMKQLTASMNRISETSEETRKIVKTIDEIAFQTNLLALNAAIEAARAGEAGAGFAVVADEVRSLAMRSADAAGTTAVLIKSSVKEIDNGADLVIKTSHAFARVAEIADKVGILVGEIMGASQEQAQGIGQVNAAVAELDKVTQQNAAIAEQAAAASEKMSEQAEDMKIFVKQLSALIKGKTKKRPKKNPEQYLLAYGLSVSKTLGQNKNLRDVQL